MQSNTRVCMCFFGIFATGVKQTIIQNQFYRRMLFSNLTTIYSFFHKEMMLRIDYTSDRKAKNNDKVHEQKTLIGVFIYHNYFL